MAKEKFQDINLTARSLIKVSQVNSIIKEYQAQGFVMTLRQIYYQMVARALIENKVTEYDNLGELVSKARLAGLIDWAAIEDTNRAVAYHSSWDTPEDILQGAAAGYREDPWRNQEAYIEVWVEKAALAGVIAPACNRWRVPYFACRGYVSQSAQYEAGKRVAARQEAGKSVTIIHLGDHDPSGIDMTRDNDDRLTMFARMGVHVERVALNMNQIEEHRPPPNPAKESDSRFKAYRDKFGDESWELDSLDPSVIDQLLEEEVSERVDGTQWAIDLESEEASRAELALVAENWEDVRPATQNLEFTREVFEAKGYVEKAIDEMPFIDDALLHKRLVEDALRDPELTRRIFANLATVRHRMEF